MPCCVTISRIIWRRSMASINNIGERGSPCRTPWLWLNESLQCPFIIPSKMLLFRRGSKSIPSNMCRSQCPARPPRGSSNLGCQMHFGYIVWTRAPVSLFCKAFELCSAHIRNYTWMQHHLMKALWHLEVKFSKRGAMIFAKTSVKFFAMLWIRLIGL